MERVPPPIPSPRPYFPPPSSSSGTSTFLGIAMAVFIVVAAVFVYLYFKEKHKKKCQPPTPPSCPKTECLVSNHVFGLEVVGMPDSAPNGPANYLHYVGGGEFTMTGQEIDLYPNFNRIPPTTPDFSYSWYKMTKTPSGEYVAMWQPDNLFNHKPTTLFPSGWFPYDPKGEIGLFFSSSDPFSGGGTASATLRLGDGKASYKGYLDLIQVPLGCKPGKTCGSPLANFCDHPIPGCTLPGCNAPKDCRCPPSQDCTYPVSCPSSTEACEYHPLTYCSTKGNTCTKAYFLVLVSGDTAYYWYNQTLVSVPASKALGIKFLPTLLPPIKMSS